MFVFILFFRMDIQTINELHGHLQRHDEQRIGLLGDSSSFLSVSHQMHVLYNWKIKLCHVGRGIPKSHAQKQAEINESRYISVVTQVGNLTSQRIYFTWP